MSRARYVCALVVLGGCFVVGPSVAAAPPMWTGAGINDNWRTGLNWSNEAAPANEGTADIVLAGDVRLTPIVDVNWSINSLAFDRRAAAFVLGGNRLTIGSGGILNDSQNSQFVNNTIVLDKSQTWNAAAGPLFFGGSISNSGTLTVTGNYSTQFAPDLSGGGGLSKSGAGALYLTGINSYSGGTTINQGSVRIGGDESLGVVAGTLSLNGGTLWSYAAFNTARNISIGASGGTFDIGYAVNTSGALSGSGPISKIGPGYLTFNSGTTGAGFNYNGTITASEGSIGLYGNVPAVHGNVNIIGSANLWLSGAGGQDADVVFNSSGSMTSGMTTGGWVHTLTVLSNPAIINGNSIGVDQLAIGTGVSFGDPVYFRSANPGITLLNGVAASTISGSFFGTTPFNVLVPDNVAGDDLTMSGIIRGSITKMGQGTLALTGANTHAETTINEGTVRILANNGLGATSSPVTLNGGTLQTSSSFVLTHPITSNDGAINVDAGTTLTMGTTFTGPISKTGKGTMELIGFTNLNVMKLKDGILAMADDAAFSNLAVIELWGGEIRAEGAARTIPARLLFESAGHATFAAGYDLKFTGNGTIFGPEASRITVNNTTTLTGQISSAAGGTGFVKDGPGTLILSGPNYYLQQVDIESGILAVAGGTTAGAINNYDRFRYTAGVLSGRLNNFGSIIFDAANITFGDGIANFSTIEIPSGKSLTVNGAGLDNQGTITLNNSTMDGAGPLNNFALISGNGTIGGTGGFNNAAQFIPSGILNIAGTGSNTNTGQIDVATGSSLRLMGAMLQNAGTIKLSGGTIGGTSQLSNQNGGTITGRGTITAPLGTSSGNIAASDGILSISNSFTNAGVMQVAGLGATLAGGTITNTGTIQGFGNVNNVINNTTGTIEAFGGTLLLNGPTSSSGFLTAATGSKLLFTQGLSVNAGLLSLAGGTFDNNGKPITNTGQISGYGIFRSGTLTNNGAITFAGGTTTINGNVTNSSGKKVEVRYAPAVFTGNFTNNGIFKSTGASVTFTSAYTENGQFISDPAENFFQNVLIGSSGSWTGGVGDRFIVSGDLISNSTSSQLWDTSNAELDFIGGGLHVLASLSKDLGIDYAGYDNNFAWGKLVLGAGDSLNVNAEALYIGTLDVRGPLSAIQSSGNIYYDLSEPGNAYLQGKTYQLSGGGSLTPVPEPSLAILVLAAIPLMLRRRYSINCI